MRKAIKQFFQNFKKDQRGLTLVELLAVVVILAIVGAIAFIVIGNVIDNSRTDSHIANAQQVIHAAELSEATGKVFTAGTVNLTEIEEHLGDLIDPWDSDETAYTFTLTKTKDDGFVITSAHSKCGFTNMSKAELSQNGRDSCGQTGSYGTGS